MQTLSKEVNYYDLIPSVIIIVTKYNLTRNLYKIIQAGCKIYSPIETLPSTGSWTLIVF